MTEREALQMVLREWCGTESQFKLNCAIVKVLDAMQAQIDELQAALRCKHAAAPVSEAEIHDPTITGGMESSEYVNAFRAGKLGERGPDASAIRQQGE